MVQRHTVHQSPCTAVCGCRLSPTFEFGCDGASLDPLEVMFVKVKSHMLANEFTFSKKAAKYQQWQQQVGLHTRLLCSRELTCCMNTRLLHRLFLNSCVTANTCCDWCSFRISFFSAHCGTAGSSHLLSNLRLARQGLTHPQHKPTLVMLHAILLACLPLAAAYWLGCTCRPIKPLLPTLLVCTLECVGTSLCRPAAGSRAQAPTSAVC